MLSKLSSLYFRFLPYSLCLSTGVGMANGIKSNQIDFNRAISSIGAGVIVGITYPISFPLIYARFLKKID